ncbi:hypothetical protein SY88_12560 [Clostridiales bacterium PH28_bin88]|nr:hypothetical protein SY88_12560 [Clostridiales bacterium PH28_bin88]
MTQQEEDRLKQAILEVMEPFFTRVVRKLEEHDQRFEQIDSRLEQLEKELKEVRREVAISAENLVSLRRVLGDLSMRVQLFEDNLNRVERKITHGTIPEKADLRQELEEVKARLRRLEQLLGSPA